MSIAPEDDAVSASDETDLTLPDDADLPIAAVPVKPQQKKNFDVGSSPIVSDLTPEAAKKFQGIMIPVLSDTAERIDADMENVKEDVDISETTVSWYQNLTMSFRSHPASGIFEDALADPNADWRNSLSHNGQNINIGRPKFNNKGKGSKMSSERLQLSVRSSLGLGAPIQVPLMGSGFYATVKPMGEDEIIALWREVIDQPIKLGRVTHGLMFSNNQVFAARAICDAWVRTLVQTTVSDLPEANLYDHISINDLPTIAHSVATSIYPNGFPMKRSVFMEDSKLPKEEREQLIDIRKSLVMNAVRFNTEQLIHMTKRIEQPMTLTAVKSYCDQFVFNRNAVVEINDDIKLHLKTPTLREYFESGEKWINEINAIVREALGDEADPAARGPYIGQLARATRLRQYSHYVSAIEENGELYSTRENVDKVLNSLAASDAVSKTFYKAISDYINQSQVAIVATTSVNTYEDTLSGEDWPRLIPIDAISVFFQLVEQKLRGIMLRNLEDT